MKILSSLFIALLATAVSASAFQETKDIALTVREFEIPIEILTPDKGKGPFPVIYHVHGGGWNGGTATKVPGAGMPPESKILCDELGIIYVGLAYRCKPQGTFQDAMEDLRASIAWFEAQADTFKADITRVGLSGGSAGTTLSSRLAQEMETCKTYVGLFGVYNLLRNDESLFPDEEACAAYNLTTPETKRNASAYHNLRQPPPATRLFLGANDILVHPTQSIRFAEKLKEQGADVELTVYPDANHGYYSPRNPVEFKDTTLKLARLYSEHLTQTKFKPANLAAKLDTMLERYFPLDEIPANRVAGFWKGKHDKLEFLEDGTGEFTNRTGKSQSFTYTVSDDTIDVTIDNVTTEYFMQNDQRAIYSIFQEGRFAGRKEHFNRK